MIPILVLAVFALAALCWCAADSAADSAADWLAELGRDDDEGPDGAWRGPWQ
jgi:hypothetical protein